MYVVFYLRNYEKCKKNIEKQYEILKLHEISSFSLSSVVPSNCKSQIVKIERFGTILRSSFETSNSEVLLVTILNSTVFILRYD